ncbi:MAG TPA: copper resistance protein CopC [Oxalobacteraceae bacterium]|nr:copper resistance protein CopC [Oxalobacteraceae bacterium]
MNYFSFKRIFTIAAATLLASLAQLSWAHAVLQKSSPASNAVLSAAPKEIRTAFNEALEAAFSTITVSDDIGKMVATAKSNVDPADPKAMSLALPPMTAGRYHVKWTAVTVDGHRTHGTYTFSVRK